MRYIIWRGPGVYMPRFKFPDYWIWDMVHDPIVGTQIDTIEQARRWAQVI